MPPPLNVTKTNSGFLFTMLVGAAALAYIVRDHLHTPYDALFDAAGKKYDVPPNLLRALARVESGMNPNARNPKSGGYTNGSFDVGLMQVNTRTGAAFGLTAAQLADPATSIDAAARVLRDNRKTLGARLSPWTWAASYNVGPDLNPYDVGMAYASKVLSHWQLYDGGRMFA